MNNSAAYWEHFEHVADIGVRGHGQTLAEAFEQAATAMMAVITDPATIEPKESMHFSLSAMDAEILLVDWLNALIYEMSLKKILFSRFDVQIENHRLTATAWGEAVDIPRHQPAVEIKGATFTALKVTQEDDGHWIAQCVIDV
jgi:tRNA nucleotidyltransferase (CCA-adding enzyme)